MGWFWSGWQYWKKNWGRLWATFEGFFFIFSGAEKYIYIYFFNFSVRTKKMHKMKVRKPNFFLNRLNIHNQLCIALLKIQLRDFYIMTLTTTPKKGRKTSVFSPITKSVVAMFLICRIGCTIQFWSKFKWQFSVLQTLNSWEVYSQSFPTRLCPKDG